MYENVSTILAPVAENSHIVDTRTLTPVFPMQYFPPPEDNWTHLSCYCESMSFGTHIAKRASIKTMTVTGQKHEPCRRIRVRVAD